MMCQFKPEMVNPNEGSDVVCSNLRLRSAGSIMMNSLKSDAYYFKRLESRQNAINAKADYAASKLPKFSTTRRSSNVFLRNFSQQFFLLLRVKIESIIKVVLKSV